MDYKLVVTIIGLGFVIVEVAFGRFFFAGRSRPRDWAIELIATSALPLLIVLMAIKFVMVAGFFMHLRFDTKLFGRFLYTGLAWAVVLYTLTLLVFVVDANQ